MQAISGSPPHPDPAAEGTPSGAPSFDFAAVVEHAPHLIARFDRHRRLAYINPAGARALGADRARWIGKTCEEMGVPGALALAWDEGVRRVLEAGVEAGDEARLPMESGARWLRWRIVPERAPDGTPAAALVFAEDVTLQKQREDRISRQAEYDPLTPVFNRATFLKCLEAAWSRQEQGEGFAVLFVDLDHFKQVNDRLGHGAGDTVLRTIGARLVASVRPTDAVGRLGGDEFAVLLRGATNEAHAAGAVRRIQQHLTAPISADGSEVHVTVSVGLALASSFETPEALLASADRAMYMAKNFGPGHYEVLDEATLTHDRAVARLERDLRRAIVHDELTVCYQPIVRLSDGGIIGLEALVRWNHPERGLLGPQAFLPVAEQSSMIVEIDRWVLRSVAAQVREWTTRLPAGRVVPVSINVSGIHVMAPDLVEVLTGVIEEFGIDPAHLMMEVTETSLLTDPEVAKAALARVRSAGVRLSLDDFGTGYSSLTYLRQFTFDVLKIDRSFVQRLGKGKAERAIVRSIVRLAHTLGLQVVAEGIETGRQRELLRTIGCPSGQGYLFGRPAAPGDVYASLAGP